jgi:hypothetical protein
VSRRADTPCYVDIEGAARMCDVTVEVFAEWVWDGFAPPATRNGQWRAKALEAHFLGGSRNALLGDVYLVGFGGYVKIGFTTGSVASRVAALQVACPERLTVYGTKRGTVADELSLHRRFASLRTFGEWFRHEGELADYIKGLAK